MSVWVSEVTGSVDTDDGVKSGVRVALLDGVTDSNGEVVFDLSGIDPEEILSTSASVINHTAATLGDVIRCDVMSETLASVSVRTSLFNFSVPVLGVIFSPIIAAGAGIEVRLLMRYL